MGVPAFFNTGGDNSVLYEQGAPNTLESYLWSLLFYSPGWDYAAGDNNTAREAKQREYITVSVSTLVNELENNAAAAQKKYKNKYVKVTGKLGTIDSDGDYISIDDPADVFSITGVQCFINKNDKKQSNFVLNLRKGQTVTAYGKITDVGELLGYHLEVDRFE